MSRGAVLIGMLALQAGYDGEPAKTTLEVPARESLPVVNPDAPVASLDVPTTPVRHPDVTEMETEVGLHVVERRDSLRAALANPGTTAGDLADAYGQMGMLYLAYRQREAAGDCLRNAAALAPREFRWRYLLARLDHDAGDLDRAVEGYRLALALRPADLTTLVWLARAHRDRTDWAAARAAARAAAEQDPGAPAVHYELGHIALGSGDYRRAAAHFREGLEIEPLGAFHYGLGMTYRGLGDETRATEHLAKSTPGRVNPPDPLMTQVFLMAGGIGLAERIGATAMNRGRYDVAEQQFRKLVEMRPDHVDSRVSLGRALKYRGRSDEALEQFRAALRLSPDHADAWVQLGILYGQLDRDDDAMAALERALEIDPGNGVARYNLAVILQRSARLDEAAEHLERVLQADPAHTQSLLALAEIHARHGSYAEAVFRLRTAHQALPTEPALSAALARLLVACPDPGLRDGDLGLELIRQAMAAGLTDPETLRTRAMAHAEQGDFDQAISWHDRALESAREHDRTDLLPSLERDLAAYRSRNPRREPFPAVE